MNSLFSVPTRTNKNTDTQIAKKVNSTIKKSPTARGGGGLAEKISIARAIVEKNLGKFADDYIIIQDESVLHNYITKCIENNVISIDTETTGLDPIQDSIVGICIYTPNCQAAYIPVNHKSYITGIKVANQLAVSFICKEFERLLDIDIIMFNACFDMRFLRNQIGVYLKCTWDCYLAARLLNENEGHGNNGLKKLHNKYVLNGAEDAFSFGDLFDGISFDLVPINTGYLYAAHDAIITYELYQFQKPFLTDTNEKCIDQCLQDVAWVFHNIEMPCVEVVADMEDTGISLDLCYTEELHNKYHKLLEEKTEAVYKSLEKYQDKIDLYRSKNPINKLSDPINIDSPTQIAILLYDILDIGVIDAKTPRGTGEDVMTKINNDFSKALLEYRGIGKLINTYIDKLPDCVNKKDGRIHCKFNQYGADTGRMSSSDPNLQNIPSHNKDIRKMFVATDGYVRMSSDFSQQEPKCLAALCRKQGDSQMYDTFMAGKDLYSEIASKAFNKSYEECCEFASDGSKNPKEYKERRTQAKSILLGINYGRGVDSIAEQLGTTREKAQIIKDSVFKGFPAIKKFEESSIQMAKDVGFVTTVCGRKRRLPSMMLPDFEIVWKDGVSPDDDPLAFDSEQSTEVPLDIQRKWLSKIKRAPFGSRRKIYEQANEAGLYVIDHTREKDVTKVVNARIQGSAADLTKLAMIELHRNKRLKELGFRMLIPVHDEIIAECPFENAKECAKLLAETMSKAAEQILEMPIKCDVEITKQWYGDEIVI